MITSHDRRLPRFFALLAPALAGALALGACGKKEPGHGTSSPEVYVADVSSGTCPSNGAGRPDGGSQDVEIRARVEGYLEQVEFTEGAFVTKGTLLYQIDPKPLEAALATRRRTWPPPRPGSRRPRTT